MATKKRKDRDKLLVLGAIIFVIIIMAASWIIFSAYDSEDLTKPTIAVIPITGQLTVYGQDGGLLGGGTIGVEDTIEIIKEVEKDPTVKAIIFEINSPGGTVVASEELAAAVKATEKPTVAWMREVAASGGYWTASACDKIVADPATITGSIGVIGSYLQFSELMETYGITYERLVSGEFKDTGSPYKDLTPAERQMMMDKINKINTFFINAVAENRNLDKEYVQSLATGEIYLGVEAYEMQLVDVLGGEREAKQTAEQLAGIKESKLVTFKRELSFWELVGARTENSAYWVGRGIGDAWNILTQKESRAIKAEI